MSTPTGITLDPATTVATTAVPRHDPASSPSSNPAASVTSGNHKRPSTDGARVATTRIPEGGEEKRVEEEEEEKVRLEGQRGGESSRGEESTEAGAVSKPPTPALTSYHERGQVNDKGRQRPTTSLVIVAPWSTC